MKTTFLTFLTVFVISINLFSQAKPVIAHERGIIIKKNNDTINCFIELAQVYEKEIAPISEGIVVYQKDLSAKKQTIDIKDIKSVQTTLRKYYNITAFKQELLFKLVINGPISLLEHPELNIILSQTGSMSMNKFGPKLIDFYALRTADTIYIIRSKKDLKSIPQIFENCPKSKSMVENKSFKLEDLESLITLVNNCK
jgi:hypothetical protein